MAWTPFLLGRPGSEVLLDVNPAAMEINEAPIAIRHRNLNGNLLKSVINSSVPTIRIRSSYLTKAQRDQLASLAMIDDTFLSFQTRDDWQVIAQRITPLTTTQVILPLNCITRLSALLVGAALTGTITIAAVSAVPNPTAGGTYDSGGYGSGGYAGPDYFVGGSYNDVTRVITLGSPLSSLNPVYVSYTYKGWLVDMANFPHKGQGGWTDRFTYDVELIGA